MTATGIVRPVDNLGRIVIPKEARKLLDIKEADGLAVFLDGERIVLEKYAPGCIFCGEVKNTRKFGEKRICPACLKKIQEELPKDQ